MLSLQSLLLLTLIGLHKAQAATFETAPGYFGQRYIGFANPRALFVDASGDVLAFGRSANAVFAVTETQNGDGTVSVDSVQIVSGTGLNLNHGVTHHNGYVYASSGSTVYRWPYTAGDRELVTVPAETVVLGMPAGGHDARTLVFDAQARLYVSIGSNGNVDPNSDRAGVWRFNLEAGNLPINFQDGEIFAEGNRNECGLAFDQAGTLFGVENGADELNRPDLGGDIHNGNPAEEMNRFDGPVGTHYGYPYCFSTYNLEGVNAGTQYAWPSFMGDGTHSDEWCRNVDNNRPPVLSMPAHTAPLGVTFYDGTNCGTNGAFPCSSTGDAFVAMHGSWNSDIPVGYKVVHIPFTKTGLHVPTGEILDIIYEPDTVGCSSCLRPVNVVFNHNGHMILSSDSSAELFKVTYGTPPAPITNQ